MINGRVWLFIAMTALTFCMIGCEPPPGEVRSMPSNVWKFKDGDVTCYLQDNTIQACVHVPRDCGKTCKLEGFSR